MLDLSYHLDRAGCACDRDKIARKPVATIASYDVQVVDGVPGKAQIWPGTGRIQVDRQFWGSIDAAQRDAVLAHELAHDEDPAACEHCADARAGARLRWSGYSASTAVRALGSVVKSRQAGASVLEGWRLADDAIREIGRQSGGLRPAEAIAPTGEGLGRRGFIVPVGVVDLPQRARIAALDGFTSAEGEDAETETSFGVPDVDLSTPTTPAPQPPSTRPRAPGPTTPPAPLPPRSSSSMLIVAGVVVIAGAVLLAKR